MYQVKLEGFEGPFDLLLNLISQQELNIYEISLSKIIEEYLTYIEVRELDLEGASEFILVAATLLEIKAATLLSGEEEEGSEEAEPLSPEESQRRLMEQLIEYKKFKEAAKELDLKLERESKFFLRGEKEEFETEEYSFSLPAFFSEIEKEELPKILLRLLERGAFFEEKINHIPLASLNLEEKLNFVLDRLQEQPCQTFRELTRDSETKIEIILVFLTLLELHKRSLVDLRQAITFGEIEVNLREIKGLQE